MRIEERGYSMITDEQGREWLFKKLYDDGWRYCACMVSGNLYLTDKKPEKCGSPLLGIYDCKRVECISGLKCILSDKLKPNEVLGIAEELGVVNWQKVAVDTPILVSNDNKEWIKRYFAKYEDGNVYGWLNGKTSWTAICELSIGHWNYAKLAEV